jgi:hypothetical protein
VSLSPTAASSAPPAAIQAIRDAAGGTGADFAYLVAQAAVESGFDPRAQSPSSSARGLFQFVEGTWLAMVRDHGAEVGLADLAAKIGTGSSGEPVVGSATDRRRILALRDDPRLSAEFAARLLDDNRRILEANLDRSLGATDLYLAHFLGAGGASRFLGALAESPAAAAADLFPVEAGANPGVFYAADGRAKTLAQIHDGFARKLASASDSLGVADAPRKSGASIATVRPSLPEPSWRPGQGPALRLDPLIVLMLANLDAPAGAKPPKAPTPTEKVGPA